MQLYEASPICSVLVSHPIIRTPGLIPQPMIEAIQTHVPPMAREADAQAGGIGVAFTCARMAKLLTYAPLYRQNIAEGTIDHV